MNQTTNDGEKMEKQIWEDIKAKNWNAVDAKIAEGFQSVHPDGARDRTGEITLIKNLDVGQVTFNDFRSTMSGDNIVVSYMISVQETIDLERLPTKPTPRLSVWKKGTHGWQWICHANLNPIP
ncbi:MAG: nuclear transport factor 2 family protein [Verrucomicrobia bacterium]|nr:MAG: nuclear transport factor 2 family protein [Verrucomicrobiota bacterium]PYK48656.1 MAG: nuclear transport factor 2 family protein [Verrucomicrobiota bacterium]